ncbi:hypothetical protein POVWA2_010850 [Plasmodium ovale wallikeri]|uniref:Uncharacterized protein n=1 Tax=Plasmodium ovale wallikeri TaxID=864142 RepID=A0A1A8YM63_PLAOA|nr:hypothetical protein POVWA1_010680 [Plasmodium ovale wallikeri]SBT32669.1 hypothetical protein POVWA2_010850 [Plasmodium ovale wallikeri]
MGVVSPECILSLQMCTKREKRGVRGGGGYIEKKVLPAECGERKFLPQIYEGWITRSFPFAFWPKSGNVENNSTGRRNYVGMAKCRFPAQEGMKHLQCFGGNLKILRRCTKKKKKKELREGGATRKRREETQRGNAGTRKRREETLLMAFSRITV